MLSQAQRILLINYEYPPVGGGGSNATFHIARAMAAQGHTPFVLTASWRESPRTEYVEGVTVHRVACLRRRRDRCSIPEMLSFAVAGALAAPGLVRHWRPDAALVFFGIPCGPIGWLTKRINHLPYAIALHGGDVPGFDTGRLASWHALTGGIIRRLWADAGAVMGVSESLASLARRHAPNQSIGVIPLGADVNGIAPKQDYANDGVLKLLFVGRLVRQKGADTLMEALAQLPQQVPWRLVVAGDGPEREALAALAVRLNAADRIQMRGWVSKAELPALYREADIFVLPSRDEGLTNVLLEATAAGLPTIGSRLPGIAEVVLDGETGLLTDAENSAALAAAIFTLATDAGRRESMGRKARARAEAHFGWPSVATAWVELLAKIARR